VYGSPGMLRIEQASIAGRVFILRRPWRRTHQRQTGRSVLKSAPVRPQEPAGETAASPIQDDVRSDDRQMDGSSRVRDIAEGPPLPDGSRGVCSMHTLQSRRCKIVPNEINVLRYGPDCAPCVTVMIVPVSPWNGRQHRTGASCETPCKRTPPVCGRTA
jgi:hypothetical protein